MNKLSEIQQSAFEHIFPDLPLSGSTGQGVEFVGLAHTLAELAWNPDRQTPFAVALPGGWGRDKTSLLRQTRHLLDGPQPQGGARKVCTLRFNAWKFPDDDSVLVGLFGALLNEFRQGSRLDQLRFQIDSQNTKLVRLLLHAAAPWAFAEPSEQASWQANDDATDEVCARKDLFWGLFRGLFLQASYLLLRGTAVQWDSNGVTPEVLWDAQTQRQYTLAIFLEDLERCTQDRILEMVEAIKLFLDLPGVSFFLDMDSQRLTGFLSEHLAGDKEAFLEKMVHAASPPREDTARDFESQDKPWKSPVGAVLPGIEWVKIPAGTLNMGSARGRDNEQPVHVVTLPGFHIARYLVTNAQYAHYVTATDASPPQHWRNGKIPEGREKHPVVYVSWREAVDFCDWLSEIMAEQGQSGRVQLPSEAEWEYAARGIEGRTYPWGNNAPDKGYCNFDNAVSDTTPVGAYPKGATPDGVHDLAGNVWEWTRSKWENYPYPRDEKGRDKREERSGDNRRTLRGCSFRYSAWFTRSACRGNAHPGGRHPRIGFRVVMSPAPSLHDAAPDL